MELNSFVTIAFLIAVVVLIGAIAGWLAGKIVKGDDFGLTGNIVIGIVGAVLGGFLLPLVGVNIGRGVIGAIIQATSGAVILLLLIKLIRRAQA